MTWISKRFKLFELSRQTNEPIDQPTSTRFLLRVKSRNDRPRCISVDVKASVTGPVVAGEKQFHRESQRVEISTHLVGDGVRLVFARTTHKSQSSVLFPPCRRFLVRFTVLLRLSTDDRCSARSSAKKQLV